MQCERLKLKASETRRMESVYRLILSLVFLCTFTAGENTTHPCLRECTDPPVPRTCRYSFNIGTYMSMSLACFDCPINKTDCFRPHCIPLNGVPRTLMTVNRQFPGPSIEVCEGDTIIVEVKNNLQNGEATSIHWHGFHVRHEQYMDGVGLLTQCPIPAHDSFTYKLNASNPGTHWWHAHTAMHKADGVFGALTVRQPASADPNNNKYDADLPEHIMLLNDWLDMPVLDKFIAHHHSNGNNRPESLLINGKGKRKMYVDPATNKTAFTDREVYTVALGKSYRFRMVSNAITNCALKVSVDGHNLTIIASDGAPLKPFETEILVIFGGERYDFVLNASQPVGNYWVRVKGLADCIEVQELAILRYEGAPEENRKENEDWDRQGLTVNPWNKDASDMNVPIVQMSSTEPNDTTSERVDVTYYLGMDFNKIDNYHFHHPDYYPISAVPRSHHLYSPQLNGISFTFPSSPLLSQYDDVIASGVDICTPESIENTKRNCSEEYCECTHVINVNLGQVVELVMVDEGVTFDASHPMHLHGHAFRVVALEKLGRKTSVEEVKKMDLAGNITRKLDRAVKKDTVIVPDGGFTIIRFLADNPGWWLLHCHLQFHVEIGMSLVIHTGKQSDLPPVPHGFPVCGAWPCNSCQIPTAKPHTNKPTQQGTSKGESLHNPLVIMLLLLGCYILGFM